MTFDLLDIIEGLEEAFFRIFQLDNVVTPTSLQTRITPTSRYRFPQVYDISLFVLWQDLYNSFDSTRRGLWTDYWLSLPFGSHAGANGYPGSGYSAFVYVNAPRYKLDLDLLLDPPALNLIYNGNFNAGLSGWDLSSGSLVSGHIETDSTDFQLFQQDWPDAQFALTPGATYRISADTNINNPVYFRGLIFSWSLYDAHPETGGVVFEDITLNQDTPYNDFVVPADCTDGALFIGASDTPEFTWTIDNITLSPL